MPSIGPKAVRASLERIISQAEEFAKAVTDQFAKKPAGLSVDELYDAIRRDNPPGSYVSVLIANQFPVFSTFMKLTLLNHLLLYHFPSRKDADGKVRFQLPPGSP